MQICSTRQLRAAHRLCLNKSFHRTKCNFEFASVSGAEPAQSRSRDRRQRPMGRVRGVSGSVGTACALRAGESRRAVPLSLRRQQNLRRRRARRHGAGPAGTARDCRAADFRNRHRPPRSDSAGSPAAAAAAWWSGERAPVLHRRTTVHNSGRFCTCAQSQSPPAGLIERAAALAATTGIGGRLVLHFSVHSYVRQKYVSSSTHVSYT